MAPCYGWRSPHTRGARGQALRRLGPRRIIPAYAGSTAPVRTGNAVGSDHPRIRGEHAARITPQTLAGGSSPHTRGALHPRARRVQEHGIIPAYAGSTPASRSQPSPTTDHPRIRGEHHRLGCAGDFGRGSSPHTRGALLRKSRNSNCERIIPAYAGSTIVVTTHIERHQDHPRIRGEHEANSLDGQTMAGSSPHTRGARLPFRASPRRLRIIPAYAGSTP